MSQKTKSFTRGGQITFHNLRMLGQINKAVFKIALLIFLLLTVLTTWLITPNVIWITAYEWAYSQVMRVAIWLNYKVHPFLAPYHGHWYWQTPKTFLSHRPLIQQASLIWHFAVIAAIIAFVLTLGLTSLVFRALVKRGKEQTSQRLIRGLALATPKQLTKEIKRKNTMSDIQINGMPMPRNFEVRHVLIHGTTGTGKSVLIKEFLDQIRRRGDRAIVFDQGCSLTPLYYREPVDRLLNPFDERCQGWDLWAEAKDAADFENIAESLIPMPGDSDPFWVNAARTIFASCAYHMQNDPERSIQKLLRYLLTLSLEDLSTYLEGSEAASLVSGKIEKTAISIRSVLTTYLRSLKYLIGIEQQPDFGFSIRDWVQNEEDDSWLFMASDGMKIGVLRPLITMWLALASKALLGLPENHHRRIWFIVDELPSLQRIPMLNETIAEVRKFGGCFVLGMQSYAQLEQTYGRQGARALFDLLNTRFFYRSPSSEMAKLVSQELGELEFEDGRESYSYGANRVRDGISLGKQRLIRPIVSYSDIMELENLTCYLRLPGHYPITQLTLKPVDRAAMAKAVIRRRMDMDLEIEHRFSEINKLKDQLKIVSTQSACTSTNNADQGAAEGGQAHQHLRRAPSNLDDILPEISAESEQSIEK